MICSFRCKETKKVWDGIYSRKLPKDIQNRALRKLRQIDAASILEDLRHPPGNNLEHLGGDRKGEMSIRINDQWRVCFIWSGTNAENVQVTDYH